MNQYVIKTNNLSKVYGKVNAVHNASMQVPKGSIYGLIGKNGAGKTTLMKMLTGLCERTEGEMTLFGENGKPVSASQRRIGLLIESPGIYGNMTAYGNLKIKAIGMGVYRHQDILDILKLVGLEDTGKKKAKSFSLGMKQRLGLGLALIGSPDMLILDEPINGLNPQGIIEIRQLLEKLNNEKQITILISSHILEELYKIITHVGIINKGEIIAELAKQEIEERCKRKLIIKSNEADKVVVVLESLHISKYTASPDNVVYVYDGLDRAAEINTALASSGIGVPELTVQNESLEDFYLSITEGRVQ